MKKSQRKRSSTLSRKEKLKEKNITKIYFFIAGLLLAVLVYLIVGSLGLLEKSHEPKSFPVDDECSLIMGNIIHNLRDEGECKIKCDNNCEFRDLEYYNSSFTLQNASCHTCDCYCI